MSVLAALRTATEGAHARLEAAMALDSDTLTRHRYGTALQVLLAAREGWEPDLARLLPGSTGPHQDWLRSDLAVLGREPLPPEPALVRTAAEGWGLRYVLEGSALGGRVLLRRAAALGLTEERGARYFAGWGTGTGARWRSFLADLEQAGPDQPGMARGAVRAFEALTRCASARLDEGLDARQDLAAPLAPVEDAVMADPRL